MIEVQHFWGHNSALPPPMKNGCKDTKNFNTEGKKMNFF